MGWPQGEAVYCNKCGWLFETYRWTEWMLCACLQSSLLRYWYKCVPMLPQSRNLAPARRLHAALLLVLASGEPKIPRILGAALWLDKKYPQENHPGLSLVKMCRVTWCGLGQKEGSHHPGSVNRLELSTGFHGAGKGPYYLRAFSLLHVPTSSFKLYNL